MSTPLMVWDKTDRVGEIRRRLRRQLRQQRALSDSGVFPKDGYFGGELRALEVAHEMLEDCRKWRKRYTKAALDAVKQRLESEYKQMAKLAGEIRGPWFLGFSQVWRRVIKVLDSLPLDSSSQTEN